MRKLTGVLAVASVGACLPFARTFITTPAIVGVYRAETGEPLEGVHVTISKEANDSLCASRALQTFTDSAGAFAFPRTERHEAVRTPFEHVFSYSLCARVAGTLHLAFEDHALQSFGGTPLSLTCIEARTANKPPVVCTKA